PEWIDLPARAGDALAESVLGARPGEVIVTDSTTVNLYKLVCAALDAAAGRRSPALVTDRANFPTDRYVLEGIARDRGLGLERFDSDPLSGPLPADLGALRPGDVAVLSHVAYRSGALADMTALTTAARERGATLIWDLSHSAGAVPVRLRESGAQLAVGCTYKYLNAGPGAPAYLYVAEELQARLRSPIAGWFAQSEQFAMERDFDPVPGIGRFLAGTPPIAGLVAVEEGVRIAAEAGMDRVREKSLALCELLIALHDEWLVPLGFTLGSPRDGARRGSHVSLRHPDGWRITQALTAAGVTGDFRPPDFIRLGVAALYTSFADVYDALDRLRGTVERGDHLAHAAGPARVT
ncbi:MAG: kynureninase, partial [Solirubrobacteraceae bacterium]|nr:kynureninase [Solirubrobacteraceae bacterium]